MATLEQARAAKERLQDLYSNRADLSFAIGLPRYAREPDDYYVAVGLHEMFPAEVNGVPVEVTYRGPVILEGSAKAPEGDSERLPTRFGDPHTDKAAMAVEDPSDIYDVPNSW